MKKYAALLSFGVTVCSFSHAQSLSVVERGPHHRTWEVVREVPAPGGKTQQERSQFVELQGGLHRWTGQEWAVAEPKIEVFARGAVMRNLQYGAIFAPNLATPEAVDLSLPGGERVKLHLLGLAYTEGDRSVLIAEVKDCVGIIGLPEQKELTFVDAFTDFNVSVKYAVGRDRLSQNVIIHQQLPSPTEWGLTEDAVLEVLTEFTVFPNVRKERRVSMGGITGEHVSLGSMEFVTGRSFSAGDEENGVPMLKSWELFEGNRSFLVEKVPWRAIAPELAKLPPVAKTWRKKNDAAVMANNLRRAPERREARAALRPIQMAGPTMAAAIPSGGLPIASLARGGYVLDWELVTTINSNLWKGDLTYYVSGPVTIKTNIFDGNCVIKYAPTNSAKLTITGPVTCLGGPYRPVVMTARDDHLVGEKIGTATLSGYYANTALYFDYLSAGALLDINNFRISHATTAIDFSNGGNGHTVRNVQIRNCASAFHGYNYSIKVLNGLIAGASTAFNAAPSSSYMTGMVQHVTVSQVNALAPGTAPWINLLVTNSLLVGVTNITSFTGAYNGTNSSPAATFQPAHGGAHYLATNSPYRNAGTTNITPSVLAGLKQRTTYPPLVYSNVAFSAQTTFTPQVQRDTDTPDLGYSYDPLDYAFGGCDGNQNITFAAGTAVGWFRTTEGWFHAGHGLHMADQKIVTFDGRVDAPAYWVRCSTVQEGRTGLSEGTFGPGGITGWANQSLQDITLSPEIRARFTRFSMLPDGSHFRDDNGYLIARLRDCEFWGGAGGGYVMSLYLTNCLMDRAYIAQVAGLSNNAVYLRNCTFKGGRLQFYRYYINPPIPVSIRDCAFDGTDIINDAYGNTDYNYNAYLNGGPYLSPAESTRILVSSFNWQTGWLGRFYLPTNSTLLDAGSLSDAAGAGLYHHTSTTNQVKEANSALNLAYHYIALNAQNQPNDYDNDGVPDYLEDANGNGILDSGETDWQSSSDGGLKVLITRPRNNAILP